MPQAGEIDRNSARIPYFTELARFISSVFLPYFLLGTLYFVLDTQK